MKINLWCGYKVFDWYYNVDCINGKWVDKVIDLDNYPRDFESNCADEIYCDNILEHLDFAKSTMEIHRILKKWWKVIIKVPYFSNPWAFFADHQHFYNFDSYNKYCKNMNPWLDLSEPYFDLVERKITFLYQYKKWIIKILLFIWYLLPIIVYKINPKLYIWFFSYLFPASELHFLLKKI